MNYIQKIRGEKLIVLAGFIGAFAFSASAALIITSPTTDWKTISYGTNYPD